MSNGTNENDGFAIDEFQVGTVVGLNNQAFDGAKVFGLNPNPAKGLVNLTFSNYDLGNYQINVIDTKGQLVLEELISIGSKSDAKLLSISDLEKGIYLVRISNGASVSTQKLVVE
jgi:hypothetical protein